VFKPANAEFGYFGLSLAFLDSALFFFGLFWFQPYVVGFSPAF